MRDFLDAILQFIGTSSLTDMEFDSLTISTADYDVATYEALASVLLTREAVSSIKIRLVAFFNAKGVGVVPVVSGRSNIFAGAVLE